MALVCVRVLRRSGYSAFTLNDPILQMNQVLPNIIWIQVFKTEKDHLNGQFKEPDNTKINQMIQRLVSK